MLSIGPIADRRNGTTRLRHALAEALAVEHIQTLSRAGGEGVDDLHPDEALVLEAHRKTGERGEHDEVLIAALLRLLQRYAPLFCRVGPKAGDAAVHGCWADRPALEAAIGSDSVLRVSELRAVPRGDLHAYVLVDEPGGRMSFHQRGVEGARLVQLWRS